MEDWKKDRIASALDGRNPTLLRRMKSGFAVLGDTQFLPGYCVLIAYPKVPDLNALPPEARAQFLTDMAGVGDAVGAACRPERINYEILGNTDAFLHAHIFPRYGWEPPERRRMPVWLYPRENWSRPEYRFDPAKHGALLRALRDALKG